MKAKSAAGHVPQGAAIADEPMGGDRQTEAEVEDGLATDTRGEGAEIVVAGETRQGSHATGLDEPVTVKTHIGAPDERLYIGAL